MTPSSKTSFHFTWTVTCMCLMVCGVAGNTNKPNIVIIMADDMGFDDVSFRGSNDFLTPNIDALAFSGVILNRHYVPPMCTPSRAAFMTGRHPIHTGMQHYVIANYEPWGLPLSETTIADVFQKAGYYTSVVGKWHLGFAHKAYTPLFRGFDHHYGYLGAYIDYYDQTLVAGTKPYARGHDFRNNLNVTRENQGQYVTDTLTEEAVRLITTHDTNKPLFLVLNHLAPHTGNEDKPLQAPEDERSKFDYMANYNRSLYAAMVSKLDTGIGQVVDALNKKEILNNTIILFYSDNGAPTVGLHANNGSNYPLRGQKNSPWEGGLRSVATIWSPHLQKHGLVWNQTMHVTDWLPTLASAAGLRLEDLKLDGRDMWSNLVAGQDPIPRKILHNIDDIFNYSSYLRNEWKYIKGTTSEGKYDGWLFQRETSAPDPRSRDYLKTITDSPTWKYLARYSPTQFDLRKIDRLRQEAAVTCGYDKVICPCNPLVEECLFDIEKDPCEQNNLFHEAYTSSVVRHIKDELQALRQGAVSPLNLPPDEKCDPKLYDYEWTWWKDI